jgi:pSer/pThr/pTyr-binding forkhead associated (FHA) protein
LALVLILVLLVIFLRRRRRPSKKPTAPLPPARPSPPWLEARVSGKARPFPLQKDAVTIGRAPDNDLVIPQDLPGWETVSRHHARLYRQGDRWIVEDLQSTNGVYVNGKRTGRNMLQDGWRLDIGGVTFIFHAGTGGAA